jgi:hypothetical protein
MEDTIQVVHKYISIPFVWINKLDFDSDVHTLYVEPSAEMVTLVSVVVEPVVSKVKSVKNLDGI